MSGGVSFTPRAASYQPPAESQAPDQTQTPADAQAPTLSQPHAEAHHPEGHPHHPHGHAKGKPPSSVRRPTKRRRADEVDFHGLEGVGEQGDADDAGEDDNEDFQRSEQRRNDRIVDSLGDRLSKGVQGAVSDAGSVKKTRAELRAAWEPQLRNFAAMMNSIRNQKADMMPVSCRAVVMDRTVGNYRAYWGDKVIVSDLTRVY